MIKDIKVLSRIKAMEYSFQPNIPDSLIISISEPHSKVPSFDLKNEHVKDVLPLFFDDITEEEYKVAPDLKLMHPFHVEAIKEFLDKYKDTDYTLIVHCYAGISRSSAVAAACALYLGLSDNFIWDDYYYSPNTYVFTLMNEQLKLGLTPEDITKRYRHNQRKYDEYYNVLE